MLALFQDKFDPKGNTKPNRIIKGVKAALKNGGPTESFLSKNTTWTNPFGDGKSSEKIVEIISSQI